MATHAPNRASVRLERTYDFLYDPVYTLGAASDHNRALFKSQTTVDRFKRQPVYPHMFSELRHYPRETIALKQADPLPKYVSRKWRGYSEKAREELVRYNTSSYPLECKPGDAQVTGKDRTKFFHRPIIPFLQQVPSDVLLQMTTVDPLEPPAVRLDRPRTPATKDQFVQTMYRESEAQTDPYTPDYVVRPGSAPELLTLATLSWGRGLPAGVAEVEMIERAREKRAWEATLPPMHNVAQLEKRRQMMDEMERKEWAIREKEIESLQEARLEVLKQMLIQREINHTTLTTKRLDRLWVVKQRDRERRVKLIRKEHIRIIRKLTRKRTTFDGRVVKKSTIEEYSDSGSKRYAPMTRNGMFLDQGSEQFVVKSNYLSTYEGILELERSMTDSALKLTIKAPTRNASAREGQRRAIQKEERKLAVIYDAIKSQQLAAQTPPKPLKFLDKIEKPLPRPPTPEVEVPDDEEEDRELSIVFLQQVIRGRAIQNMLYEGKEKRIELIRELRSTHALQDAGLLERKEQHQATLSLQAHRVRHEHTESKIDEALCQVEGESLGDMLDFLSKELIRLQEERRIHAFAMLAERERRIREAEESGMRQLEERRRREEDEMFKQVIKVRQNTVDQYLEEVILKTVDVASSDQAKHEIHVIAKQVNDIAYERELTRDDVDSEEIVADMVHGFLLPEVTRLSLKEKINGEQRKHLAAAHSTIFSNQADIERRQPTAPPYSHDGSVDFALDELVEQSSSMIVIEAHDGEATSEILKDVDYSPHLVNISSEAHALPDCLVDDEESLFDMEEEEEVEVEEEVKVEVEKEEEQEPSLALSKEAKLDGSVSSEVDDGESKPVNSEHERVNIETRSTTSKDGNTEAAESVIDDAHVSNVEQLIEEVDDDQDHESVEGSDGHKVTNEDADIRDVEDNDKDE